MSCPHTLAEENLVGTTDGADTRDLASLPKLSGPVHAIEYWIRPEQFMKRCQTLGERFILKLPGVRPMLCITGSADIKAVFTGDYNAVCLGEAIKRLAPHEILFGPEVLVDGEDHIKFRQMVNPYFRGDAIKVLEPLMAEKTREALQTWPLEQPRRFFDDVQPLVLDIIIATVFGVTDAQRTVQLRKAVLKFLAVASSKRFAFDFAVAVARDGQWRGKYRYIMDAKQAIDALVCEELQVRRDSGDHDRNDLLGAFMRMRDDNGKPMPDPGILNFMRGLLVAGYETTALTLAWLVERTSRHPEVIARLERSIDENDDTYVNALINETMRIRSPVMLTPRSTVLPFEMNGLHVPQGTYIVPFIQLAQWNPAHFENPMRFDPERFVNERPNRSTWIPFGGGVRTCLGMAFSLMETRVILKEIFRVRTLKPTTAPNEPIKRRTVMLMPKDGARVVWTGR